MSHHSNKLFIILGLVLVLAGAYYALSSLGPDVAVDGYAESLELMAASEKIITDTNKVDAIIIDGGFFVDTNFRSLVDRRVTLPPVPTGRINPFAPLP